MFEGLKKRIYEWLAKRIAPIEVKYTFKSPQEEAEVMPPAFRAEEADLMKQNMLLKKRVKELEEKVAKLEKKRDEEIEEMVEEQARIIESIKAENSFTWYLVPEKPIQVYSVFSQSKFYDQYGVIKPFLVGIRLHQTPNGVIGYLLLSDKTPFLYFPGVCSVLGEDEGKGAFYFEEFPYVFSNLKDLVLYLKRGIVGLNYTLDGKFIPPRLGVQVRVKKPKKEIKKGEESGDKGSEN